MATIKQIIRDFKTPPVAVRSANVKPAKVTRVQTRAEVKQAMSGARVRARETA
jgi:hypothetical protein